MGRWASLRATDARIWQILALATLIALSNLWSDFGSGLPSLLGAAGAALATQFAWAKARRIPFDWRSALITAGSLALLLRTPGPGWHALAACCAISSKYLIRWHGKHIFNPANITVVAFLLASPRCWITPGQWGSEAWLIGIAVAFAALVLGGARRIDIALAFAITFAGGLFARAAWLGDPVAIPWHQVQSGALVIFTFFMITDPRSTPDHRLGRILFAAAVALLAILLRIRFQLAGAPLFALAALSPLTPLLDRLFSHDRFAWRDTPGRSHAALA